jgi:hypothetical protein
VVILQWRTAMHTMCACGTALSSCSLLSAVGPGAAEPRARAESWVVPVQAALHATQQSIFHALFHCHYGAGRPEGTGGDLGGHAFSTDDGVTWTISAELLFNETVATMGGQSITFDARQRPHLVIDTAQGVDGAPPSGNRMARTQLRPGSLHKGPGGGGEHAVDEAVQGLGPSRLRSHGHAAPAAGHHFPPPDPVV